MTFPSDILALARAIQVRAGTIYEVERDLHVGGVLLASDFEAWSVVIDKLPQNGIAGVTMADDIAGVVDIRTTTPMDLDHIRILVGKRPPDHHAYFFTIDGAKKFFHDESSFAGITVLRVAEGLVDFRTRRCRFTLWDDSETVAAMDGTSAPIRPFCRGLSSNAVPQDMRPWLLDGEQPQDSAVFVAWRNVAATKLAASLASEAWKVDEVLHLSLQGPRKRIMQVETDATAESDQEFTLLSTAANWVYGESREAEVRHALLAHEIAREWPAEAPFLAGFKQIGTEALTAAQMAYRLHLQGTTEKTLKVLGELRKTLSDDVNRISQQSRDLTSGLWRDLTVALTAVIGRVLLILGDKPAADSIFVRLMLFGTAAYVAVNAAATLYANQRFAALAKEGITLWRNKLYGFLDDAEMETFALGPLAAARRVYQKLVWPVVILYCVTVLALGGFALHSSEAGQQSSRTNATPASQQDRSPTLKSPDPNPAPARTKR